MLSKSLISVLAVATSVYGADLTVQTPASLITCQPVMINWSGGQGPYFLAAIPGGQPSAPAIKDFGQQTGNTYTWNVDLPAGTSVTLRVTDQTGMINYNQAVTVQPGANTACIGTAAAAVTTSGSSPMMSSMSASASGMTMMSGSSTSTSGIMFSTSTTSTSSMSGTSSSSSSTIAVASRSATPASAQSSGAASPAKDVAASSGLVALLLGAFGAALL